jgi:hypothetical protein
MSFREGRTAIGQPVLLGHLFAITVQTPHRTASLGPVMLARHAHPRNLDPRSAPGPKSPSSGGPGSVSAAKPPHAHHQVSVPHGRVLTAGNQRSTRPEHSIMLSSWS